MGNKGKRTDSDIGIPIKKREGINWLSLIILMVFYAGTWTFAWFYHVTEIYNTSIVFVALILLFFNNVPWVQRLKAKDPMLIALIATLAVAIVNLFIIGSNKGCFLILADFCLILYLAPELRFTALQQKALEIFFLIMFISWFLYDRTYSYNANTGATVTVFTLFGAMVLLTKITEKRELFGFFTVIAVLRTLTLVLWHLARGAFIALAVFLILYYLVPASFWEKKVFYYFLMFFSTFGSLMFVAFYVWMGSTGFNMKLPFFYKNIFSGREQIWYEVWEMLHTRLLTGIGSGFRLKSFFEYNIHNAMYDILAVHGIIVFAGMIFLIIKRLLAFRPVGINTEKEGQQFNSRSKRQILVLSAIFAIFIESFIDMDLMWADYSPLLLFLFYIAFQEKARNG